ncbi:MAG: hypothetical protein KAJ07_09470, partial [Planctomycetes bacterium]|nr:hypothetical protein [Planctomycetota bacterium]
MPDPAKDKETENSGSNYSPLSIESLLRYRILLIVFVHIVSFAMALMLAFLLAKNMQLRRSWLQYQYPGMLLFILPIKLVVFAFFKQYRGWWKYVGISDLIGIVRAALASTIIIVSIWYAVLNIEIIRRSLTGYLQNLTEISQGVFLLDLFVSVMILGGLRMVVRMYHEEFLSEKGTGIKRLLIIGAGDAGEALLREIMRMKIEQYDVAGFIDDDPAKQGMSIHGVSVLGTVEQLSDICQEQGIDEITIA